MSKNNVKVLLVEDQKLMRVGLKALIEELGGIDIVAEAQNGKEAIELTRTVYPDVILMDIGLPDINGIEVTKKILEFNKRVKVVMLTSHISETEVFDSLVAGASAYVLKDINTELFALIIKSISEGAMWFAPQIVPFLRDKNKTIVPQKQYSRAAFREKHSNLTQREYEVLKLVVDGKSNYEIAQTLTISEHTAKAHVCNIIQKLVVDDRTQAAVKALREGIV